jgi:NADH-quinone oxidoreductase subunit J
MTSELLAIGILSILALAGGFGLVLTRNPMYAVLFLVLNFFCIGGLYLTLHAEFLAVVQIIVYAGAIMVLFLFVIMLLNLNSAHMEEGKFDWRKGLSFLLGAGVLAELSYAIIAGTAQARPAPEAFLFGKVEPIGMSMMTSYLFPFEMISLILLAALMGALTIAKKHN